MWPSWFIFSVTCQQTVVLFYVMMQVHMVQDTEFLNILLVPRHVFLNVWQLAWILIAFPIAHQSFCVCIAWVLVAVNVSQQHVFPVFIWFSHSKSWVMFCTVSGTLFSQKVRGQPPLDVLFLLFLQCHKLACPLMWFSSLISHSQNRQIIVEMLLLLYFMSPMGSKEGENLATFGPRYCHMVDMSPNPTCHRKDKTENTKRTKTAVYSWQVLIICTVIEKVTLYSETLAITHTLIQTNHTQMITLTALWTIYAN